jgi:hypothetical protein
MLHPDEKTREKHAYQQTMQEYSRDIAGMMRSPERRPFLAPWWLSPQIAYWSGQPGIAGTSHQSLAGIVDSARFFLAENESAAAKILRARGVRYVVVHDIPIDDGKTHDEDINPHQYPAVNNAALILGLPLPATPLGYRLAEHPRLAPPFLRQVTMEERGLVIDLSRGNPAGTLQFNKPQYLQFFVVRTDRL